MSASEISRNDHSGVIAPPPLVFLSFVLTGVAADCFFLGAGTYIADAERYALAAALGLAAAAFLAGALGLFRAACTRPEPWKPTTAIVTAGVYRVTRNPMYISMALACAGLALAADSLSGLALLVPAVFVIHYGVILRESVTSRRSSAPSIWPTRHASDVGCERGNGGLGAGLVAPRQLPAHLQALQTAPRHLQE